MYIYSIYNNQRSYLTLHLVHEKEFTQEEFEEMCKESGKLDNGGDSISYVYVHLKNKFGFKDIGDFIVADFETI